MGKKAATNKTTPAKSMTPGQYPKPKESRINTIIIVSGRPGIGKTKNLKKLLEKLARGNEKKPPQKVLIFDVNDEYDLGTPTRYDMIKEVQKGSIRRLLPYKRIQGKLTELDVAGLQDAFVKIIAEYSNGVLVLEDFSAYCVSTKKVDIMSTINRARHKGIDVIVMLQDIDRVTRELWGAMGIYRFHKQTNDIDLVKHKISRFPLVKIADNIVSEQYEEAEAAEGRGQIGEKEKEYLQEFFVEIDFLRLKIYGSSWPAYERAVRKWLIVSDRMREIKNTCLEKGWNPKNIQHQQEAIKVLLERKYRAFFGGRLSD